jgi:heme-degrading monooxygenase HmoA
MFARVTTAMVRREAYEAALVLFRESTVPIVERLDGYRGVISLGNRAENRVITMTLWATEDDRRASGMDRAVIDNVAEFGPFVVGSFSRDQYDVVTDTWVGDARAEHGHGAFARVTTTQLRLDSWDEGLALVREITDRPAGSPAGFRGSLAMVDATTGKVLVLEVWDTRSALTSYEASVHLHDRVARERHVLEGGTAHAIYRIATVRRVVGTDAGPSRQPAD